MAEVLTGNIIIKEAIAQYDQDSSRESLIGVLDAVKKEWRLPESGANPGKSPAAWQIA